MEKTMEERVARLEKQVARLMRGRTPRDDGKIVWQKLEERHLRAWENRGGIDHTDVSKHLDRVFNISLDDYEDLIDYLRGRSNAIPFVLTDTELTITVDRGTIRVQKIQ